MFNVLTEYQQKIVNQKFNVVDSPISHINHQRARDEEFCFAI